MITCITYLLLLAVNGNAISNKMHMDTTRHNYVYADGSNNHYEITWNPCHIKYRPVKPEESSTGIYSGGTPFAIVISEKESAELITLLDKAFNDASIHDPDGRKKGAGWVNNTSIKQAHCLVQGAAIQKEIEAILFAFRKSTHIMKGRIVEKAYVNKRGVTTDQKEYYFIPSDAEITGKGLAKEYFIKFIEGIVPKNELLPFIEKDITLTAVVREGLWDTMNPEQASRVGHYVAVQSVEWAVGSPRSIQEY